MIHTGLVSVTFRRYSPQDVIKLVQKTTLKRIEWGGDVHVPPGETETAKEVAKQTEDAGLTVAAYGSYYRVGVPGKQQASFDQVLETAAALGAPLIRLWAGDRGSRSANDQHWDRAASETQMLADQAKQAGIALAFEFHGHTLNDEVESTERLMTIVNRRNVGTLWQPNASLDVEYMMDHLRRLRKWLYNIHVFHWHEGQRRPLVEAENQWCRLLAAASAGGSRDVGALLEFVQNDSQKNFLEDAQTLRECARSVNRELKRASGGQAAKRKPR
jgi:sugar phosphate isomerase/epimerase